MSTRIKIQISRLAIIACVTVFLFGSIGTVVMAQSVTDMLPSQKTAMVVASMDAVQLLAYIALSAIGALVLVIGFYVKTVSSFQKETAVALASITAGQAGIATALHGVAETCNRRACK